MANKFQALLLVAVPLIASRTYCVLVILADYYAGITLRLLEVDCMLVILYGYRVLVINYGYYILVILKWLLYAGSTLWLLYASNILIFFAASTLWLLYSGDNLF